MKIKRKGVLHLLGGLAVLVALVGSISEPTFAAGLKIDPGTEGLEDLVTTSANNFTSFARKVIGLVAVVLFIIGAIVRKAGSASGDERKIEASKKIFSAVVLAIVLIFFADKLVGALYGILGIKIPA